MRLVQNWPDETTHRLLTERSRIDGVAVTVLGEEHSEFGRILFTEDLDGMAPYLDPTQPLSRELTWAGTSPRAQKGNQVLPPISRPCD